MGATWFRVRADLRRRLRSTLILALLLGLFGGVVLAAGAGARRTDSAYDRFLVATRSADLFVLNGGADSTLPPVDLHKVARLPQVRESLITRLPFGLVTTRHGHVLTPDGGLSVLPADAVRRGLFRPKMLAGRLPDPSRVDEIAVGYRNPPDPDVRVGAVVTVKVAKASSGVSILEGNIQDAPPDAFLPAFRARIVGIVLTQGEIQGSADIFMTDAFGRVYGEKAAGLDIELVQLRRGLADFPAFSRQLDAMSPQALVVTTRDEAVFVHRSTHLQSVALWLFAGLAGLAGLVIFGQALARQVFVDSSDNPTLQALGMTRSELAAVSMLRVSAIAVIGAVLAAVVAVALSPLMPLGLARLVEPAPGVSVDALIVGLGAAAILLVVVGLSAWPAWRSSRVRDGATEGDWFARSRPSAVAGAVGRSGLPPTVAIGVRLALEPGRGRSAVPVWSALFGVMLSFAAFATAFSLEASFHHLVANPQLYGWGNIQLGAGSPYSEDMVEAVLPAIRADPGISAYGVGNLRYFVEIGPSQGVRASVWAVDETKGTVHPTIAEGKWPTRTNEIALGAKTLRAAGAHLGDTVRVRSGKTAMSMRVVGRAVVPDIGFGPGLGEGATMSFQALKRLVPEAPRNLFVMRVKPGVDEHAVARRLTPVFAPFNTDVGVLRDTGESLSNVARAQAVPVALAGILGFAAIATLVHTLVTSIRRRRRDLAVLKTLGFVKGQVSAAVAWQATTLVVIALLIGIPLGVAAGRWAWRVFADQLGFIAQPVIPLTATLLAIPLAILAANLIAVIPGRLAGRTQPALILRTE